MGLFTLAQEEGRKRRTSEELQPCMAIEPPTQTAQQQPNVPFEWVNRHHHPPRSESHQTETATPWRDSAMTKHDINDADGTLMTMMRRQVVCASKSSKIMIHATCVAATELAIHKRAELGLQGSLFSK
eukprot:TRINITY_DN57203_c0_g1_i1.p1 TRINITY_DN57203_c0_g1~~TRINITY_DN57203_c0_g1_i1.p1  ORF type:complete len:128 (-),score=16.51 TRINITY_DN57203_c0_g1_i1:202-585(-)